jgi:hypothetical protein
MMNRSLFLSITAFDDRECVEAIIRSGILGTWPPDEITFDSGKAWRGPKTVDALRTGAEDNFSLRWSPGSPKKTFLGWDRLPKDKSRAIIKIDCRQRRADIAMLRPFLEEWPFAYCAGSSASGEWGFAGSRIDYIGCSFGNGHNPLGWMCAFKGEGHKALVSRRWLEFGPWRLIRGKDDLSLVQFHDLAVDDETALEQARPGHQRMGNSAIGGFIPVAFTWDILRDPATGSIKGLYDDSSQTLIQVVAGRKVDHFEMMEAAAVKARQPLAKPVRQVAYVFIEEANARAHLHELWLYGLEVRGLINGREIRIDEDYAPVRHVPDWVKRVQDREGF